MLNAVKHLYRCSNQLRLRAAEMLYSCSRNFYRQNKTRMPESHWVLSFLFILAHGFGLIGVGQAKVYAQSITKATTKPNSQRIEAQTLKKGIAHRQQGESDTSFLRRVLPVSYRCAYNNLVVSYAWRATPLGKQLFFSRTNGGDNEYDLFLFVLDPFKTNTYAVQAFDMGNMGDLTTVAALFFDDVDQDGQKELLVLSECDLKETVKGDDGERLFVHVPHYEVHVFKNVGLDSDARPQYREDKTPRSYLDELPTAAAVRQALIRHRQKSSKRKSAAKL
jgi:hypothetical protein